MINDKIVIKVCKAISKKTQKEYEYLHILIGEYETRVFFRSPLEVKECKRILQQQSNIDLND